MTKIWFVPIEPFELRYTQQWFNWFKEEFTRLKVDHEAVLPLKNQLSKTIRQGSFLDVVSTNHYKAGQLQTLCELIDKKRIKEGDVIFFADLWFPGLEMLAYIRDGMGLKIRIGGCLHAGTYDPWDFLSQKGMWFWGKDLENSWFKMIDFICVATTFHKDLILIDREVKPEKIFVTGWPLYYKQNSYVKKDRIVVFPHRLDPEKQPEVFDEIKDTFDFMIPDHDWEFVKTMEEKGSKEDYYNILALSKIAVSCAKQETFGIAMAECVLHGCFPLVPNRLSYPELYPSCCLYEDTWDLFKKLVRWMNSFHDDDPSDDPGVTLIQKNLIERGRTAIKKMVDISLYGMIHHAKT